MANAILSPKELAALLECLDRAQLLVASMRAQLIRAMAARREPRMNTRAAKTRRRGRR